MSITSARFQNIDRYISMYIKEKHTYAKYWYNTDLVERNAIINPTMEDFYGTVRYLAPLGNTLQYDGSSDTNGTISVVNVATQDTTEGSTTNISTYTEQFIKQYKTYGTSIYDYGKTISMQDIDSFITNSYTIEERDRDNTFISILNGISDLETSTGNSGRVSPDTIDPTKGFFVDLGATAVQAFYSGSAGKLIDEAQTNIADKLSPLVACLSLGWSDYDMGKYYLLTSPSEILKLKIANVIDYKTVTENGIEFSSILDGKIILLPSRSTLAGRQAKASVTNTSTKTSMLIRANSMCMVPAPVINPVAFDDDQSRGRGSGLLEYWYRWSYVMHPKGYSWTGGLTGQPTQATLAARASWTRRAQLLNLGILPIFHV